MGDFHQDESFGEFAILLPAHIANKPRNIRLLVQVRSASDAAEEQNIQCQFDRLSKCMLRESGSCTVWTFWVWKEGRRHFLEHTATLLFHMVHTSGSGQHRGAVNLSWETSMVKP